MSSEQLRYFRRHIPAFECTPGCHDCCGPVTASSEEIARLPVKSPLAHTQALSELSCPYLGENGCHVYLERPLICRLFGTTPQLPCPNGKGPNVTVDQKIEQKIFQYFAETRQVLL